MLSNAISTAWISQHQRKRRGQGEDDAAQTANVTKEKRNEDQTDQRIRGRPGQGPALLYGRTGLCQEGRFQSGPISLADRGVARGGGRHGAPAGAEQQRRGQGVSAGDLSTGPARGHVLHRRRQGRLRADQGPRRRVHDAAHRRDRLDHCDAERHLRQPHSAHPAGTLLRVEYTKRVESVFEIIAEPNRRAILSLLVSSQQSVGEIARQLRMPQPTVSKHLRVLREAGFVESTVDAQRRLYRLKPEPLQEVDAWLAPFRRFWSAHVDALERHLDRMESVNANEKEDTEKTTRPKPRTSQRRNEMKIKLTSVYVDDQDKALRFYTEVLGFAKKTDVRQGPYRWLTVVSPEEPDGTELQLALNDNPAAKAYQQAIFQQGQPAAMFYTGDVKGDYERIKARGAEFTMPPTGVTGSTIAMLKDTCGNLIQLTELAG